MFVSTAEEMNASRRSTMEDCHVYHPAGEWECTKFPNMSFLGVYDGHGGGDIVGFLDVALASNIAKELDYEDDASMEQRLERAFLVTDIQSRKMGLTTSGATVAVCLVEEHPEKRVLHVANAGDARIVLGRRMGATSAGHRSSGDDAIDDEGVMGLEISRLSCDHRADDVAEMARITEDGGYIIKGRVMGILAVSRSLGDHCMKQLVLSKPHVKTVEAAPGDMLVLACDGLFDVVKDHEAIGFVKNWDGEKSEVARCLVREALKRGSGDNITVVVALL